MAWIIQNDEGKLWNASSETWEEDDFDTFDDEEKSEMPIPSGGVWVKVPWNKQD